jgi:hypothetical protein
VRLLRPACLTAAFAVVALGLVAGAPSAPATVASRSGSCPAGARGQITAAYSTVFDRGATTSADERATRLADSTDPALRSVLDAWLLDTRGGKATATVNRIRCTAKDRATVAYDLILAGNKMPGVLPKGRAVLQQGVWKVARSTFCARMILENPSLATTGACAR